MQGNAMSDPLNAFVPGSQVYVTGAADGPLVGLRFAAKDIFDIAGHVTGSGNPDWARTHDPATAHAPVVRKLLDAGATLIGKTITDELTRGILGINAHYGTPLNPEAPDRVPGGSSSGSASAVAGGLVDFALGSDTGGSVRIPSSFCGIYGLRPTHGRIPLEGILEQSASFDTIGWFARDPAILARAGAVLFGSTVEETPSFRLLVAEDAFAVAGEAVSAALAEPLDRVRAMAETSESVQVCPTELKDWRTAMGTVQSWEATKSFAAWVDATNPRFGFDVAQRFFDSATITDADVAAAGPMRQAHCARMAEIVTPGTVIALPTAPGPAPLKGLSQTDMWDMRARISLLTCIAGGAGLPQVAMPLGSVEGAPVGLSLIGPAHSDEKLLALAAALQG
jgi:amidase